MFGTDTLGNTPVDVQNANPNGQTTMSASSPVVIASDQGPVLAGIRKFGNILGPLLASDFFGFGQSSGDSDQFPGFLLEGVTSGLGSSVLRTPDTFKTASASAAGNTAVWTPVSTKKFHLLRYRIEVTANAAAAVAGILVIQFQDATTGIGFAHSVFIPGAAGTTFGTGYISDWIDLGGWGILSAAANNVLNINLSFALTAGAVRVNACGMEE